MSEGGVTHKELNEALSTQTKLIIAKINRTEDSLKVDLNETKTDLMDDIKTINDRVTYIERRNRWENFFASIVTFFSMLIYGKFSGG